MEGKNVAFGAPGSSLFAASTTVTSTGSVNSFHDSFTPFGGGIALFDIALEQASRMFVPFQRLGDTDNTTGIGLGLALSRGLTEAMDGTLEPEDTPGGGLTMALSLPAVPGTARTLPGEHTQPRGMGQVPS